MRSATHAQGKRPPERTGELASALVIALSMVTIIAIVCVAFFTQAQLHRHREAAGAARIQADILARSGIDYVLCQKIGVEDIGANSYEVPTTAAGRSLFPPKDSSKYVATRMASSQAWDTAKYPTFLTRSLTSNSSVHISSTTPDFSGSFVAPSRWNAPRFGIDPAYTSPRQPEWIYFDASGPTTTGTGAIGRIAYVVYDITGLLDVNTAGHPSSVTGVETVNRLKATPAGADLSGFPGLQNFVDTIRNAASISDFNNSAALSDPGNAVYKVAAGGFLKAAPGDTQVLSRSELIRFAQSSAAHPELINELPYLTAWSRSYNAPTPYYVPPQASGSNYLALNSIVWDTEQTLTRYRIDGTAETYTVKPGDPIIRSRFPLERFQVLADAQETGPSESMRPAIKSWFGLEWVSARVWSYTALSATNAKNDPTNTSLRYGLMPLEEVKSEGREPNFAEILKSHTYNFGTANDLAPGRGYLTGDRTRPNEVYGANPDIDFHLMRIFANILDSIAPGNIPTTIQYNAQYAMDTHSAPITDDKFTKTVIGTKDIPYLYGVRWRLKLEADASGTKVSKVNLYAKPYFANAFRVAPGASETAPPSITAYVSGSGNGWINNAGSTGPRLMVGSTNYRLTATSSFDFSQQPGIALQGSADNFRTPAPASSGGVDSEWLLTTFVPQAGVSIPWPLGAAATTGSFAGGLTNVNFVLKTTTGGLLYDKLRSAPIQSTGAPSSSPDFVIPFDQGDLAPAPAPYLYWVKPDPRTYAYAYVYGSSTEPSAIPSGTGTYLPDSSLKVSLRGDLSPLPGRGDLNAAGMGGASLPMADVLTDATHPARNFMLGRPLRSVGELGYIYREMPWQSLNFNYENFQERTWLDCFSVIEEPAISPGRWNLNTPFPRIMRAYLAGATKKFGATATFNDAEVSDIVDQIITRGTPASYLNGKIEATNPASGTRNAMPYPGGVVGRGSSNMGSLKEEKEAVVRALASSGQTRTWNFFIDLIAQSGRMEPKATNIANFKFNTLGEQHLWVHVALDRFTGKVIASQVEVCHE